MKPYFYLFPNVIFISHDLRLRFISCLVAALFLCGFFIYQCPRVAARSPSSPSDFRWIIQEAFIKKVFKIRYATLRSRVCRRIYIWTSPTNQTIRVF